MAMKVVLLAAAFLLCIPAYAYADPIDMVVTPASVSIEVNKFGSFGLTVTNNMGMEDYFQIGADGPNPQWRQPTTLLFHLKPKETGQTQLQFLPTQTGTYAYEVSATSINSPSVSAKRSFAIVVTPPEISVTGVNAQVDGGSVKITVDVKTSQSALVDLSLKVTAADGSIIKEAVSRKMIDGPDSIEQDFPVTDFLSGSYVVEVSAGGSKKSAGFDIQPVRQVQVKTSVNHNFLYDEVVIEATNMGNVVEHDYAISQLIRKDAATGFVTKPQSCTEEGSDNACTFVIGQIDPKQTKTITYRYEYWPSYTQALVVVLIAAAMVSASYMRYSAPKIRKRRMNTAAGSHHIVLEIRNRRKHLKNVIVRDFVTPLAHVVPEFENVHPVIKKSEAGTELIWKLGQLSPGEHRFIAYKIKPLVVGSLKMPRAYIRWGEGERMKKSYSTHVTVE